MKIPILLVTSPKEMCAFLGRIYENQEPAPDWKRVAIDSEYYEDSTGKRVLSYFQLSNGKEKVVVEGPLVSQARGKFWDLPRKLKLWFEDPKVKKRVSTTRAEWESVRNCCGATLRGLEMDTEVVDWLLDENRLFHGLKNAAKDHVQIIMHDYKEVFGYRTRKMDTKGKFAGQVRVLKTKYVPSMKEIVEGTDFGHLTPWTGAEGREKAVEYAALDPYATYVLCDYYEPLLKHEGLWEWYTQVERKFTECLMRVEPRGIKVEEQGFFTILKDINKEILRSQHVFRELASEPIMNLRSNPQLQELFFKKLHWPVKEVNKPTEAMLKADPERKKGNPCLDAEVLADYAAEGYKLAELLLKFKNRSTMKSNFVGKILELLSTSEDGVLRTIFKQARTKTGRLASGSRNDDLMNLQNIPARKEKDPYNIRKYFQPTRPGYVIIVGDYSQVELYITCQYSGDKRMIVAFNRGEDLHMLTAAEIFKIKLPKEPSNWSPTSAAYGDWKKACAEWKEKWKDQRSNGKIVNFGIIYGMSAFKLARDFNMDEGEAQAWIDAYFELYPGVKKRMDETIEFCQTHGYVLTVSGRKRRLPEIMDDDMKVRGHAERQAMNFPIQGSAADIIKVAMNALEFREKYRPMEKYMKYNPLVEKLNDYGYEQLLQVHDEVVGQCPEEYAEEVCKVKRTVMELPFPQFFKDVKLTAAVSSGPSWAEGKA